MKRVIWGAALALTVPTEALAGGSAWVAQDVGKGCKMVLSDADLQPEGTDASTFSLVAIEWVGKCAPNGLALGPGTLTIDHQAINVEEPALNHLNRAHYKFTAANGVMDGAVTWAKMVRYPGKDWVDAETEKPKIGYFVTRYRNGCEAVEENEGCETTGALSVRDYAMGFRKQAQTATSGPSAKPPRGAATSPAVTGVAQKAPIAEPAAVVDSAVSSAEAAKAPRGSGQASAMVESYGLTVTNLLESLVRIGEPASKGPDYASGYTVKHAGAEWDLDLSNCVSDSRCKAIQVHSCFASASPSETKANGWNNSQYFGRAFMSPNGQMCIDMTMFSATSTMDDATLRSHMTLFRSTLKQAREFFARP